MELLESKEYIRPSAPRSSGSFDRAVQNFLASAKDHKKQQYKFNESTFLIYENDREHLTTKLAHFRAIVNVENNDLI